MILTYQKTTVFCDTPQCTNNEEVITSIFNTKSQNIADIKRQIREQNYIITRNNRCYCPECAKKMHLRNANK